MSIVFASIRTLVMAAILFAGSSAALAWHELSDEWLDVVYVPTPHQVVKRMLEIAKVGPEDIHYDLGSGDGRIAIASVRDFNAKRSVGIDLDPQRIKESLDNLAAAGVGQRVTFLEQDIFKTDFSDATVVTLYLLNRLNIRLRPALLAMRPGTRVVTQSFTMNEWDSDYSESVPFEENGSKGTRNVFLYIVPARVAGNWILTDGTRSLSLEIRQEFQRIGGTAAAGDKRFEIRSGRLRGSEISFAVETDGRTLNYEGKVDGNEMNGAGWRAKKSS
jgi:precorrin-6B methylase 2